MDRRRALQLVLSGGGLGLVGALGVPMGRFLLPLEQDRARQVASFSLAELGLWESKLLIVGGQPAIAVNTGEGVAALSAVCSHLGCIVKWRRGRRQFFCPCHGARFDLAGRALGGPTREPLARLTVKETEGQIVVEPELADSEVV